MSRGLMVGLGAAAVVALVLAVVLIADSGGDDTIADGIRIGTVDAGGLDAETARERVRREFSAAVRRPVQVTYKRQRFVLRSDKAGVRVDAGATVDAALERGREGSALGRLFGDDAVDATIKPRIAYSREKLEGFVERVAKRVDRGARDADIDVRDGKLSRTRARNGVEVKQSELLAGLVRTISSPSGKRALSIPVTVTERPDRNLVDIAKRYPTVIGIDRDAKTLRLYENLRLTRRYKIAVGKQGLESSAGRYKIEEKIVNPPWNAPNKAWAGDLAGKTIPAGDPRNPLEARWMGYHDGEGIHGTADIASLGTQASHGCIRMSPTAVKQLFSQVKVGTPVFLQ